MSRRNNPIRQSEPAGGATVAEWTEEDTVAERTADRWAGFCQVRDEVEAIRRTALDRALGRPSDQAADAAEQTTGSAAELVRHRAVSGPVCRIGLVVPTGANHRDTLIERPSGRLAIAPVPSPGPLDPARPRADRRDRHNRHRRIEKVAEIDDEAP
jgi:hypothetical protein